MPGYCAQAGIKFIGPSPEHLGLFGDKARAREAAIAADVPVLQGIDRAVTFRRGPSIFRSTSERYHH